MSSNLKTVSRIPLVFTTTLLLACVAVSTARASEQFRTETVKFYDLNVNTPAGAEALFGRIHAAAKRVCSESDPIQRIAADSCAKKAEAQAVAKLGLPQLTAYYQMKTGAASQQLIATR
jgi:UrcA family protein